jgi:cell wall-associated NlpC family hydrolase
MITDKSLVLIRPADLTASEMRQYKTICAALFCYYNADKISYQYGIRGKALKDQMRPPPFVPEAFDCSAFVTYCYNVAGAPDPNGAAYAGGISTGSLWANGRLLGGEELPANKLAPGDLLFYGYGKSMSGGPSEHTAIYISDSKCISHGSDEGPLALKYNESTKPFVGARRYVF